MMGRTHLDQYPFFGYADLGIQVNDLASFGDRTLLLSALAVEPMRI
jgi:hypothetical protein